MDGERALAEHPWSRDVLVRVRMALHTGEPRRHEEGYVGMDVHRAAGATAVRMFVQHAQMVRPDFALDETNVADVVTICRRLDGLPLAIELAAARSKLLGPQALLARLDSALEFRATDPDRPARQRTLRDTIGSSYRLLSPLVQRALRSVAVFAGGCEMPALAAVLPDELDPLETVAELVDLSLVTVRDGYRGEPRIGMPQTVRPSPSAHSSRPARRGGTVGAHALLPRLRRTGRTRSPGCRPGRRAEPARGRAGQPAGRARLVAAHDEQ